MAEPAEAIQKLLKAEKLAVLATQGFGAPHASLMAFLPTEDLGKIYLITPRDTEKYRNLQKEKRVSLLVDNRCRADGDVLHMEALTIDGKARELEPDEKARHLLAFLERYPSMDRFARSEQCVMLCVEVSRYSLVSRLEEIQEWRPA